MAIDPESFTKGFIVGSEIRRRRETGPKQIVPYLTFSSPSSFTIAVANSTKNWDGKLEYSTDTKNWTEWNGTTTLSSGSDNKLYLRGTGNSVITGFPSYPLGKNFKLTGSQISCIGDIRTLLNHNDSNQTQMGAQCFRSLFSNCTSLVKAPNLPSYSLSIGCYALMFKGCSNLIEPPELPAEIVTEICYHSMFSDCTNLVKIPKLPAMTLESGCYQNMFSGCTNIKISSTNNDEYKNEYRIPINGNGVSDIPEDDLSYMFNETGGTFTGTPEINTTYYTSNEIV